MQMASSEMMNVNLRRLLATVCLATMSGVTILAGCGGGGSASGVTGATLTGHLYCPYSNSVVNAGLGLTSTVDMTCSGTVRTMTSNGVPDHEIGAFPNANNPHTFKAANAGFMTTLDPAVTGSTTTLPHVVGFANNGVRFDPATAETIQNAGATWNVEALGGSYNFGTDSSNGHVQPDGTYHYHGMPEGHISRVNPDQEARMTLVGFANDGFPIYARWGYAAASDPASAVNVMKSSYRLQAEADPGRPSTATVPMGTYTQDYEYVAGLGDLDECNGRTGVTPDFPAGIYHYYITDDYPYIQRCIKGTSMTAGP